MNTSTLDEALGSIRPLYRDPAVHDVVIDAADRIYVLKEGGPERAPLALASADDVLSLVHRLASMVGRTPDSLGDCADFRLADGTRVTAVLPPAALGCPVVRLRKLWNRALTWDVLLAGESLDPPGREVLEAVLATRSSVVVAGNLGGGKTSMAGLLVDALPEAERIVAVERNAELFLRRERCVRLEATRALPFDRLIRVAAALGADRLVVNELQGSETMAAVEVMRGGVPVLAVVHANEALDALSRIEQMCLLADLSVGLADIRAWVAAVVGFVVFCERFPDGARRVSSVAQVLGLEDGRYRLRPLYGYDADGAVFTRHGMP